MARHSYRAAFERLKADLSHAGEDSEVLERAQAALDTFTAAMVTDPRKLRWVADESPSCAAEIEAMAARLSIPRRVLDPAHDPSYARLWAAALGDVELRMMRQVLSQESSRRSDYR